MSFTAEDVVFAARDRAPEFRDPDNGVDRDVMARAFNEALLEIVLEVIAHDPERLEAEYEIPSSVWTGQDDIDLTDDGVGGSGTREWFRIDYFDYETDGERDECVVVPIEKRHRAVQEYRTAGRPLAFPHDRMTKLRMIDGWDNVDSLWVWGILLPMKVTSQTLGGDSAVTFDYPRIVEDTSKWRVLTYLAQFVGISDQRIERWENELGAAKARLINEAKEHFTQGARVEGVPYHGSEV